MSSLPHLARAFSTIAWLSAAVETSARTASAWPPPFSTCSTTPFAPASLMSATTTRAPSRAMPIAGHQHRRDPRRGPLPEPLADPLPRPAERDLVHERVRHRGLGLLLAPG